MTYVEQASDHAFTAFLAACTPGRVLRDRSAMFSKPERKRAVFLREKSRTEQRATDAERAAIREEETRIALAMAREMRRPW